MISTQPPHATSRSGKMVEEIERLAALRQQGSLTEEEFTRAKSLTC
jgi:hypothetical protein